MAVTFPLFSVSAFFTTIFIISRLIPTIVILKPRNIFLPHNLLLPTLDANLTDKLSTTPASLDSAAVDFGGIVKLAPTAVLYPSSTQDIVSLVKSSYNQSSPFTVAARGCGHSARGQATAENGVVVEMKKTTGVVVISGSGSSWYYADVGGGMTWIDVLNATLARGLAPVSWTDYLYLTVGGTLSNAGIGGQSFRFGPQISNVHELDVINGKAELLTCSKEKNSELFYGVLGGLGQFGIITRARIALQPAPKRVKWVRMLYSEFSAFTRDQERLISINGKEDINALDYVEGSLLMDQGSLNNWRSSFFPPSDHQKIISSIKNFGIIYCLDVVKHYDDTTQYTVDKDLQLLSNGLSFIPGFMFEKDASYVEFLDRVRSGELKLKSQKLWEVPHPWLNLFMPRSQINEFNDGVFKGIVLRKNITTGPVLFYPMNKTKWDDRTSAVLPDDEDDVFYTVGFLYSSGFDDWEEFDNQNKEILEFCRNTGIKVKQYLPHYTTRQNWIEHFGSKWKIFEERKTRFDPKFILAPGQKIFKNN